MPKSSAKTAKTTAKTYENFSFAVDKDGIALATWDMPNRSMNVLSESSLSDLHAIIERIAQDDAIVGAVITSGKESGFCAGADLEMMGSDGGARAKPKTRAEKIAARYEQSVAFNQQFRKLETCGKPVAAALNGLALGGGLEVALCCHYRVVVNHDKIQLGLPEAKVGLLPGGGGTQRLPRLIGAQQALPLILQGTSLTPQKAHALGVVHALADDAAAAVEAAKAWIRSGPSPVQPWDEKGFRVPGGAPNRAGGASSVFTMANAMVHKTSFGNYPAQRYILSCVYEGLCVPMDAGLRIESRYFAKLQEDPRARAMIRSLFLSMQALRKGANRPQNVPPSRVKKLGILGAGMMGAGIAHVSAQAGMEVVLLDRDQAAADKGKAHTEAAQDKLIARKRSTEEKKQAILKRICATSDYQELKGCDLIIEAVFEDRTIKADVTAKAEPMLAKGGVFGSNTSTLPISGLAEASRDAARFIGIHFFSPVERMQLVEIIMGKQTSDEALARAMDYVAQIRKTPIVVNDSRGFFTSRCFGTYVREGLEMLAEGVPPAMIENIGRMTGMPMPPLALNDEVSLELGYRVRQQTKKDLGDRYQETAGDAVVEKMVTQFERLGKKSGKGFYDWPQEKGGVRRIWPELATHFPSRLQPDEVDVEEVKKRFLYIQALETARCFEEKVLRDIRDGDVGAILGWGFAPWSGGPLSLIDMVGTRRFVEECEALAQKYGERFMPPALLRDMAAKDERFYERFAPKTAKAS